MWRRIKRLFRGRGMAKNSEASKPLLPLIDVPVSETSEAAPEETTSIDLSDYLGPKYIAAKIICYILLKIAMKFWGYLATLFVVIFVMWWMYGGMWAFFLFSLICMGVIYNAQDMLLYYPNQPATARLYVETPVGLGVPFENIFIRTEDGIRINAMLIKQAPDQIKEAITVIYFHGNAGNIGHRLQNAYGLYTVQKCNILLVEYRGYGKSEGKPTERGLTNDAKSALEYLLDRSDINKNKIVIFGRSLGGAVAVKLASQSWCSKHIMCLILENTFTSLPEIARHLFDIRIVTCIPDWFHKNHYFSKQSLQSIVTPTLFLSGLADTLIPPSMMQHMYDVSGSKLKRLARFEAGTHNETWLCPGYYETINRFIAEVESVEKSDSVQPVSGTYSINVPFNDGGGGATFNL